VRFSYCKNSICWITALAVMSVMIGSYSWPPMLPKKMMRLSSRMSLVVYWRCREYSR
jgi:hypothetical protein